MSETSIIVATATTDLSGDVISTPSELSTEVIVDTGDGLQRAIATANIEGTVVSEASDVNTECVVETSSGDLQRALKVYNLSDNGGGGGSEGEGSKDVRVLQPFTILDNPVDGVYSVEWTVEKPDSQFDDYVSTFTLVNKSDNKYVFTAGETTKDGVVTGHPHMSGWFTFYDSTQSTAFDLPVFTYDSETGEYSAELDGYEFSFSITEESETQVNFVGGLVYKNGVELGDFNLGFWNEPLPLTKGSFDSTTQQLTLNYDYLVEMINSSAMLTNEQKAGAITDLDNSDKTIGMTTSLTPTNDYLYMFQADEQVGASVDVATPVTLRLAIIPADTTAIISGLGTYKAIADFNTFIGEPMTEEQAEAQFSPFIVDNKLCTVSGTLGSFSVEFGKDEPDKPIIEKYGATISDFLGDVDSNGVLLAPSGEWSLNFSDVKVLRTNSLPDYFLYKNNGIKTISFPDLETIYAGDSASGLQYFAQYSSIERFNCPKLKSFQRASGLYGCNVFHGAFGYCPNFKGINSDNGILFPEVEDMTDTTLSIIFSTDNITFISFPKLKKISGWDYGVLKMTGPSSASDNKVTSISFPLLEELSGKNTSDYKECSIGLSRMASLETAVFPSLTKVYEHRAIDLGYCTALTSVSFPALKSNSFGINTGVTKPFHNMLQGVTGCTVHFPSNMQSVMENMDSVTAGFGGTNTTVLFDLPATE